VVVIAGVREHLAALNALVALALSAFTEFGGSRSGSYGRSLRIPLRFAGLLPDNEFADSFGFGCTIYSPISVSALIGAFGFMVIYYVSAHV